MDLYAVFAINDGYEGYEELQSVWLKEDNAHKAAEEVKSSILEGRRDSRYKLWWAEEALNPEKTDVLTIWRLYDTLYKHREDNHSDYIVEIRYISTGD